ncbi:MAG: L-histidine N(alpha)-methyltransferase [Bradymonadaceae bacterium]
MRGLSEDPPRIPCKFLYDQRGSQLFEAICKVPEYYPARVELELMNRFAREMAWHIGPEARIVELGSGSGEKTRLLLEHLDDPAGYAPVDISLGELESCLYRTLKNFPDLDVHPVCADYTTDWRLPVFDTVAKREIFYYPGSTIGNFSPAEAVDFMVRLRTLARSRAGLLIGVDLKKDPGLIERAYNDLHGITAEFNRNVLHRINRELGADFNPRAFAHHAPYLEDEGCIEMRLVSVRPQEVVLDGTSHVFEEGDHIVTQRSHKYSIIEFTALAKAAGWRCSKLWTDEENLFGIWYLQSS